MSDLQRFIILGDHVCRYCGQPFINGDTVVLVHAAGELSVGVSDGVVGLFGSPGAEVIEIAHKPCRENSTEPRSAAPRDPVARRG